MKKVLVCLALVLTLTSQALAASVPSKTTQDMTQVVGIVGEDGTVLPQSFVIEPVQPTPEAEKTLQQMYAYVVEQGLPIASFFDDAVQAQLAAFLPSGFNLSSLVMYEFIPIQAINYSEEFGSVVASFQLTTPYEDGQAMVSLVGIVKGVQESGDPIVEWTALATEIEGGVAKIHFPQDLLPIIEEQGAMLLILSEELAG